MKSQTPLILDTSRAEILYSHLQAQQLVAPSVCGNLCNLAAMRPSIAHCLPKRGSSDGRDDMGLAALGVGGARLRDEIALIRQHSESIRLYLPATHIYAASLHCARFLNRDRPQPASRPSGSSQVFQTVAGEFNFASRITEFAWLFDAASRRDPESWTTGAVCDQRHLQFPCYHGDNTGQLSYKNLTRGHMVNSRNKTVWKSDASSWSRREILTTGARVAAALAVPQLWLPKAWGASTTTTFDYYISTTGNDSNPGTLTAPWAFTSFNYSNANNAKMAGKRVGLIAGTYDPATLTAQSTGYTWCMMNVPAGTSSASTYIASCNTSGVYTPRVAIIEPSRVPSNPILGGNGSQSTAGIASYITIDGLTISWKRLQHYWRKRRLSPHSVL